MWALAIAKPNAHRIRENEKERRRKKQVSAEKTRKTFTGQKTEKTIETAKEMAGYLDPKKCNEKEYIPRKKKTGIKEKNRCAPKMHDAKSLFLAFKCSR